MTYKFILNIIIRVLLILANCFILAILVINTHDWFSITNASIILVVQIVLMIVFLNKINRELSFFLSTINDKDASDFYSNKKSNPLFMNVYSQFNRINRLIHDSKTDKYNQYNYYKTIHEQISTGLLSFTDDGSIDIFNNALKNLLKISNCRNVKDIDNYITGFGSFLLNINPTKRRTYKLQIGGEIHTLLLNVTIIKSDNNQFKIITIRDINPELMANEVQSYNKLIRILTHEIANSIGPISSSIDTVLEVLEKGNTNPDFDVNTNLDKIISGLEIIKERSVGLKEFISKYKDLTRIKTINTTEYEIRTELENISRLFDSKFKENHINIKLDVCPSNLVIKADKHLLNQVIINLLENSIQAFDNTTKEKTVQLKSFKTENSIIIEIFDNGCGIEKDDMENIFTPFYSTKQSGSGIGLSLCRQIINLHNGLITATSELGEFTKFVIEI